MGVPQWIVDGYAELSEGFAKGFADTSTDNVEKLAGHLPRDFEQFARTMGPGWASSSLSIWCRYGCTCVCCRFRRSSRVKQLPLR